MTSDPAVLKTAFGLAAAAVATAGGSLLGVADALPGSPTDLLDHGSTMLMALSFMYMVRMVLSGKLVVTNTDEREQVLLALVESSRHREDQLTELVREVRS